MGTINVESNDLKRYLRELFAHAGMSSEDAGYTAECLVATNLNGVDSHGVLRTASYLKRVESGAINAAPVMKVIIGEGKAVAVLDGDNGMGYIVGKRAMEEAIDRARRYGIGFVEAVNSNHFGAASLYATIAADAGMLGIATTNVIPNIGMKGNKVPSTGNNPIALAAPIPGKPHFSLDISMSAVAGGKLLLAIKNGEKIPFDWAVTKEGKETDDPMAGFEGFLLPLGLHKGFGISLFIDIATGLLAGGPFLHNLRSMYKHPDQPSLTTHAMIAIDPEAFIGREEFEKRMKEWYRQIKATPMVNPEDVQIIPGEIEVRTKAARLRGGFPLSRELADELETLGLQRGIPGFSKI